MISQQDDFVNIVIKFSVTMIPLCSENKYNYNIDSYALNTWSKYIGIITQ